jgi:hypothetical protein
VAQPEKFGSFVLVELINQPQDALNPIIILQLRATANVRRRAIASHSLDGLCFLFVVSFFGVLRASEFHYFLGIATAAAKLGFIPRPPFHIRAGFTAFDAEAKLGTAPLWPDEAQISASHKNGAVRLVIAFVILRARNLLDRRTMHIKHVEPTRSRLAYQISIKPQKCVITYSAVNTF